jgi:hypothetical protein
VKHSRSPRTRGRFGKTKDEERADAGRDVEAFIKDVEETDRWRTEERVGALRRIAALAANARWSRALLSQLVDELTVNDVFYDLVGDPGKLPRRRYPQAVILALAIRHSWRRDALSRFAKSVGMSLGAKTPNAPPRPRRRRLSHK